MLGVLDSVESLLNEKELRVIEAKKSATADLQQAADESSPTPKKIVTPKGTKSAEIPLLDDVVTSGIIELVKPVRSRAATGHRPAKRSQVNTSGKRQTSGSTANDPDDSLYFSAKLQKEVDSLVSDVIEEYSEKLLDRLREKLRQRVAYLLIQSKEEKLRR